jgi:hypothetical protein
MLAGVVLAATLGGVGAAAGGPPILRSATVVDRRVVVEVSVSDVRPVQLTVATRRAVDGHGALIRKYVRLREAIQLPPSANGVGRWQSRKALVPGIYFVQVMAVDTGGVTDCPGFLRNCLDHWSNVRRVVVSPSS